MKTISTIILAAAAVCALVSCNDKPKNQPWDPNAMISLRADAKQAANVATKAEYTHLTPLEIVKQTATIKWFVAAEDMDAASRGFADHQRDTVNNRLLMWGTDVINADTLLQTFITAVDFVFVQYGTKDTIAYVPNSALRNAEKKIRAAFAAKDYETCYRVFDEAYRFIPTTGEEWRALREKGEN